MKKQNKARKLDICICAKNRFPIIKYVLENVENIIKEVDCNIILIDGMSTDETIQTMINFKKSHNENCILEQIDKNSTYIDAYNKAMSLTTADYVCWLDSDDLCDKNRFKEQIKFLDENKDVDIVSCMTFLGKDNMLVNTIVNFDNDKLKSTLDANVPMREICHFQSCMFRRSCLKIFKNGVYFYPEYVGGFAGEGFLYTLYFKNKKFANITSTYYIYNIGMVQGSLSNTLIPIFSNEINELELDQKKKEIMKLFKKYNTAEKPL